MSKIVVEKRIMTFGTFDGLHRGHLEFFKQARKLSKNPFLIVSIARDKNVRKIKGSLPHYKENKRMALVKETNLADKVVLGGLKYHIPHIIKMYPDIIALGYDQKEYVENLQKDLKNNGILVRIVRLRPYKETVYKNHLLKSSQSRK